MTKFGLALLSWLMPLSVFAAPVEVTAMRARKSPPGATMTAVYGDLHNAGAKKVGVLRLETPVAGKASFHETVEEGGLMRMKSLPRLVISPGEKVSFLPGAKHIMLEQLKPGWDASGKLPLTFIFDDGSRQEVVVLIQENL